MATAILDKLLQTQFGKSILFWMLLAFFVIIAALAWDKVRSDQEIKRLNQELVDAEKSFSKERERIIREQITLYENLQRRIEALAKTRGRK
jgi:hypothetical protein